jgi:HK97 family phage major capsid protein
MKFTVLPFLMAMVVAIANMPTDIYQICAWDHGTEKTEPWRAKLSTLPAVQRLVVLSTRVRDWFAELTDLPMNLASEVGAIGNIKQLIQDEADNKAAITKAETPLRKVKKEARELMALETRTAEQEARFKAVVKELDPLEDALSALHETRDEIAANLTLARRLQDDERKEGAKIEVGKNREEEKAATLGEVMQAMAYQGFKMQGRSDRAATILPSGVSAHVIAAIGGQDALMAAASGASSGVPESGGLLVRNEWNTSLLDRVKEEGKLAPRCFQMPIGEGNDGVEAPYVDETSRATGSRWGGVQVYRSAEAAAMTASQPKLGKFELRLEDLTGLFYATDRVLRDATLLEALATKAFTSEFAFKLDDEIVRGGGQGQCLGIVGNAPTVSVAKENGQAAATVNFQNIVKMYSVLLARCMPGAEWFINQTVLPQLYQMYVAVGTGGVPAYLPANGLSAKPYGTLMGLPVNVIEQASALGTVGDIFLANFSNDYALISKPMTSASSIHVLFTSNQTTFRWVWPVIGKPVMASAITPYKGSATFGPFVTLATRA